MNNDLLSEFSLINIKKFLISRLEKISYNKITLNRGDVLYTQGQDVSDLGFVKRGLIKCSKYTQNGLELNPHYFYEGEIFPEYLLLTGQKRFIYTLVADKRSEIWLVDNKNFKNLLLNDNEWARAFLIYIAQRGLRASKWVLCNSYNNARSKIAYMLLEIFELKEGVWTELEDNQRVISSKLHLSRTSYNMELSKLEKEGFIKKERSKILICDKVKLEEYI